MSANETMAKVMTTKAQRVVLAKADMAAAFRMLNDAQAAFDEAREAFYRALEEEKE